MDQNAECMLLRHKITIKHPLCTSTGSRTGFLNLLKYIQFLVCFVGMDVSLFIPRFSGCVRVQSRLQEGLLFKVATVTLTQLWTQIQTQITFLPVTGFKKFSFLDTEISYHI